MKSVEYRQIISTITRNVIKKRFPGLKKEALTAACTEIAKGVHARMYGANVDGVDSPIWRNCGQSETNPNGSRNRFDAPPNLPNVDASELLKVELLLREENEK